MFFFYFYSDIRRKTASHLQFFFKFSTNCYSMRFTSPCWGHERLRQWSTGVGSSIPCAVPPGAIWGLPRHSNRGGSDQGFIYVPSICTISATTWSSYESPMVDWLVPLYHDAEGFFIHLKSKRMWPWKSHEADSLNIGTIRFFFFSTLNWIKFSTSIGIHTVMLLILIPTHCTIKCNFLVWLTRLYSSQLYMSVNHHRL